MSDKDQYTDENKKMANIIEMFRKKQKAHLGILAGCGAMLIVTVLWVFMGQKLIVSWMALAAAFAIAYSIQYIGKTVDSWIGIIGGVLTVLATIIGHLSTAVNLYAKGKHLPVGTVLSELTVTKSFFYFKALMRPIDVIFFLGAIFAGYWFSYKHIKISPFEDS